MEDNLPKIRTDLIIQEMTNEDGSKHFIIKDPLTNNFFKVGEPEYFIISNFDGRKSASDIIALLKDKFDADLAVSELAGFVEHMQKLCFLDNELTRKELLKKQKEADSSKPRSLLGRLIFFKIKALNPGRIFELLAKPTSWFFTKTFVWLATISIFLSFFATLYNTDQIALGIGSLFSFEGLVTIYLSGIIVIILHEFAHGLTCTRFGGRVSEVGFLMIYFQPAFYCNVSDAWLFTNKNHKLWVSFSGGFFQLFIYAVALFVWRVTQTDLFINQITLGVMAFSGIASIINFNPLLRYDGYYLLSDYIEIPNLRLKAKDYWISLIKSILRINTKGAANIPIRERRIYFYYGFFSFIYIVFVLGYLFYMVAVMMVESWGGTGLLIFSVLMIILFRNIIVSAAKTGGSLLKRKRPMIIFGSLLVIFLLIIFFGHWELRIKGQLKLSPVESLILKYDNSGYAQLIKYDAEYRNPGKQREVSVFGGDYNTTSLIPMIAYGDTITKGQIIARLTSSEVARYISEYGAQINEAEEELEILKQGARPEEIDRAKNSVEEYLTQFEQSVRDLRRSQEMYEKDHLSDKELEDAYADSSIQFSRLSGAQSELALLRAGSRPEEIRAKEAEIARIQSRIDSYQKQADFSEIKSTIDGIVLNIDTGEVVCEIAPVDFLEATITLSEKELSDIEINQAVKFKVRSYPAESFYGVIYRIDEKIINDYDDKPSIRVFCRVENENRLLKPGMTGIASVYCGKRQISYHIYRKFFRTIRTEFWDWFDWS